MYFHIGLQLSKATYHANLLERGLGNIQGLQKLGVDALAFDYPLGPSKAFANRVVSLASKHSAAVCSSVIS